MKEEIENDNSALLELEIGILASGIVFCIAGIFFVSDKTGYALGIMLGVILAGFSVWHMKKTLDVALDLGEKGAVTYATTRNLLRYGVIVIVFALILWTKVANPLAAFLGLMSMKVAAYLQPFTHKLIIKLVKSNK